MFGKKNSKLAVLDYYRNGITVRSGNVSKKKFAAIIINGTLNISASMSDLE